MLCPHIMLTDARAPHLDWPRARVPGVAAARLAVPRSTRLSGAPGEPARSQARGRRERGEGRVGDGGWDQTRGVVFETRGWGRTGDVRGGWPAPNQPPPPSSTLHNLPSSPLVPRHRSTRLGNPPRAPGVPPT